MLKLLPITDIEYWYRSCLRLIIIFAKICFFHTLLTIELQPAQTVNLEALPFTYNQYVVMIYDYLADKLYNP